MRFEGLAVTHDVDSERVRFAPGCFSVGLAALERLGCVALPLRFDHWAAIGRVPLDSIRECAGGLAIVGVLEGDTPLQLKARDEVRRGALSRLSCGYRVLEQHHEWSGSPAEPKTRVVDVAVLVEVSLVPVPRNQAAKVLRWWDAPAPAADAPECRRSTLPEDVRSLVGATQTPNRASRTCAGSCDSALGIPA